MPAEASRGAAAPIPHTLAPFHGRPMGIKFLCPHGHKLNVKSFLAGKKGVCPECGERFLIPLESTPQQRVVSLGAIGGNASAADAATHAGAAHAHPAASMTVATATAAATWPASNDHGPTTYPSPLPAPVSPSTHVAHAAPIVVRPDPLEEAPQATWYVRPPTGGQFGPAKGDLLKRWIAEGRVSADSLVWREGWAEWQTAGGLLPGVGASSSGLLAPAPTPPVTPYPSGPATPVGAIPAASPSLLANSYAPTSVPAANDGSSVRPAIGKRPRSQFGLVIVLVLASIAILMMVALVWVIRSN